VSSVALHHVVDGPADAPPLVLAGSLGSTLEMWRPQVDALAGRFRVIRLDHRGHGGSPVPPGPYAMPDLAGDVLALLDALGLDRVAFCGLSLGGMVGLYLAAEQPDRLASLTACCTTAHFDDAGPWRDRIAAVESKGTAAIADTIVARWFTPAWAALHPDVVTACQEMVAGTDDAGYAACCAAILGWDHDARLPDVAVPTLVIGGADDLSTPVDPYARRIADGVPGARLEVVPGGHLATIESADAATALLAEHAAAHG
jgi:3-oxoadipate enol-lactonase